MKTNIFLLALCSLILFSCKKNTDPKPLEVSELVAGSYSMTEIITGGQTIKLPYSQSGNELSGTIEITSKSPVEISLSYEIISLIGGKAEKDNFDEAYYVKKGSKDIEIFEDETFKKQIGSLVDGKTLFLVFGETDRITSTKK